MSASEPKFTVVLSGYETAPYLPKSLGSIASQTYRDFEAICYVEESTDDSLEICRRMERDDPRFRAVTAPKSGAVATTRNYAIANARGEYLVVLDGDDWLMPDALEKIAAKLDSTGELDVLSFAALTVPDEESDLKSAARLSNFRPQDAEGVFSGIDAIRKTGANGGKVNSYTWLSAYRTKFLRDNDLRQSDGLLMEDFGWMPRVWLKAERFAYLDEALYVYRRRANSLTTEASPRIACDIASQLSSLMAFAEGSGAPKDVMRLWSNQWLATAYWFLFHPVTSRKIPDGERLRALGIILKDDGLKRIKWLSAMASKPRRIALPLVLLAARGFLAPAKLFFRKIYYPLVERRKRK